MKTKIVKPYGMLYSQKREYFLLSPEPIRGDSWESITAYRFAVVPRKKPDYAHAYPHARHIVVTDFVIEYSPAMPEIEVRQLDEGE